VPGPRLLTSLEPIEDPKLTPEQIRETVRKLKADGANLVKIFASRSIRQGGTRTLSDEQTSGRVFRAKTQGLRTLVHAYRDAVRAAANAVAPRWSTVRMQRKKTWTRWRSTGRSLIRRSGW